MTSPLTGLSTVNTTIKQPQQIWSAHSGASPFIFNNDTVNTLYLGPKQDILRHDPSSAIPVPPLAGQSWPDTDIWAFAPTSLNMLIIPDAQSYAPSPVQVQQALNAAGLSSSLPSKIGSFGPFAAAGGAWTLSPDPVFTTGGGYELVLTPVNPANGNGFLTDITITHKDSAGNEVFKEALTVGNHGIGNAPVTTDGVIIRGNLQGTSLHITGFAATQAGMNGLLNYPAGNNTLTGFNISVYSLPYIPESEPRVAPMSGGNFIPAGCLNLIEGVALTNVIGNIGNAGPCLSYSGPAVLNAAVGENQGGGFQFFGRIQSKTVTLGAGLYNIRGPSVNGTDVTTLYDIFLDGALHTLAAVQESTVANNAFLNVVAKANI